MAFVFPLPPLPSSYDAFLPRTAPGRRAYPCPLPEGFLGLFGAMVPRLHGAATAEAWLLEPQAEAERQRAGGGSVFLEHGTLEENREQILQFFEAHDVAFFEAATGMGKSSLIPQFILDSEPDSLVWQLQPRRMAAKRLAQYVADARHSALGEEVGFSVRGEQTVGASTRLVYMTAGYFLHFALHNIARAQRQKQETSTPRWCTHLLVDEVHEASEEIELVLLTIRALIDRGELNFKVIILSATMNFEALYAYFDTRARAGADGTASAAAIGPPPSAPATAAPAVVAKECLRAQSSTPYQIDVSFLDDLDSTSLQSLGIRSLPAFNVMRHRNGYAPEPYLLDLCARLVVRHCCQESGARSRDVLVFLPGLTELETFRLTLERRLANEPEAPGIVVLHSMTLGPGAEVPQHVGQQGRAVAYLASAIAETSVTLPELGVVIDFGLARGSVFDATLEMEHLATRPSSRTSARQRAGRVGRTAPGRVYRLYTRAVWDEMPEFDAWGAQRNLEYTVLLLLSTLVRFMGVGVRECLGMLSCPPSEEDQAATLNRLQDLDAVCLQEWKRGIPEQERIKLTCFGEFAVHLGTFGPRLARLVYCGLVFGNLRPCIVLAAFHAVIGRGEVFFLPNPTMTSKEQDEEPAPQAIQVFADSDDEDLGMDLEPAVGEDSAGARWVVRAVRAGGWADRVDLRENDELAVDDAEAGAVERLLATRPVALNFLRRPARAQEARRTVSGSDVQRYVEAAVASLRYDGGLMSEPMSVLRLFHTFLSSPHDPELKATVNMQKLKQVDVEVREAIGKLRSLCAWPAWSGWNGKYRSRGAWVHVYSNILYDKQLCWELDLQNSFVNYAGYGWSNESAFLYDFVVARGDAAAAASELALTICAACPDNFAYSAARPRADGADAIFAGKTAAAAGDAAAGAAAAEAAEAAVTAVAEEGFSLTLRNASAALSASTVQKRIAQTYGGRVRVEQVVDQPSGNFLLTEDKSWHFQDQTLAIMALVPGMREGFRRKLPLVTAPDESDGEEEERCAGGEARAATCGELVAEPVLDWHLMRAPTLQLRPGSRTSLVGFAGPVPGIEPPLRGALAGGGGAGAAAAGGGFRLAVALELEAMQLKGRREGRQLRSGKSLRSFGTCWLPQESSLALLLTFWNRGFLFEATDDLDVAGTAPTSAPADSVAYAAVTFGDAFTLHLPSWAPLPSRAVDEFRCFSEEVRRALCDGWFRAGRLPSLTRLQALTVDHDLLASHFLPRSLAAAAEASSMPQRSFHRSGGFGQVRLLPPTVGKLVRLQQPGTLLDPQQREKELGRPTVLLDAAAAAAQTAQLLPGAREVAFDLAACGDKRRKQRRNKITAWAAERYAFLPPPQEVECVVVSPRTARIVDLAGLSEWLPHDSNAGS